jgi:hypothetical protein
LQDRHCRTRHCTHPPIHAEYTSTLLSVHAIWGSASAPTAEHQRRRPGTAGDRAGKQNRQFIGAQVERFRHFSDLLLHLVALIISNESSHTMWLPRRRMVASFS